MVHERIRQRHRHAQTHEPARADDAGNVGEIRKLPSCVLEKFFQHRQEFTIIHAMIYGNRGNHALFRDAGEEAVVTGQIDEENVHQ